MIDKMEKLLKDVFKDYVATGNIAHCIVKEVNLYKKSNKLVIHLAAQKTVEPSELIDFEMYLKRKFNSEIEVNIDNAKMICMGGFPHSTETETATKNVNGHDSYYGRAWKPTHAGKWEKFYNIWKAKIGYR